MLIHEIQNNQFFTSYEETKKWLNNMKITNFSINSKTLEVTVNGDVDLRINELKFFPVKFKYVTGDFNCNNNLLTSLKGAPDKVDSGFRCVQNQLTNLQYAPSIVGGDFNCAHNDLTSLYGAPQYVGGDFECYRNALTSLYGAPQYVGGNFDCCGNHLKTLEGCPPNIKNELICDGNNDTLFNITKFIKSAKVIILVRIQPDVLFFMWVFLIKSLKALELYNASAIQDQLCEIINKHLRSDRSGPACQIDLIDAGLGKYIKI